MWNRVELNRYLPNLQAIKPVRRSLGMIGRGAFAHGLTISHDDHQGLKRSLLGFLVEEVLVFFRFLKLGEEVLLDYKWCYYWINLWFGVFCYTFLNIRFANSEAPKQDKSGVPFVKKQRKKNPGTFYNNYLNFQLRQHIKKIQNQPFERERKYTSDTKFSNISSISRSKMLSRQPPLVFRIKSAVFKVGPKHGKISSMWPCPGNNTTSGSRAVVLHVQFLRDVVGASAHSGCSSRACQHGEGFGESSLPLLWHRPDKSAQARVATHFGWNEWGYRFPRKCLRLSFCVVYS